MPAPSRRAASRCSSTRPRRGGTSRRCCRAMCVPQEIDMPIKIEIPTPMREQSGGKAEIEVTGATVGAVLADLVKQYPAMEPKLFQNGTLRPYINIFVNNEDIRYLDEMDTALTD